MRVRSVAKWLGIYLACNLITAVGLFAAFHLLVHFAPPISRETAIGIASRYLNNEYTQSATYLREHSTDCAVENYPEGEFGRQQTFEVTCSLMYDSSLVARTTFVFDRDSLASQDVWELDGQDE